VRSALVPHFILQPLVENALEHGIARRAGAGLLVIAARAEGTSLLLTVGDDGPGMDAWARSANGSAPDEGVGLGNTRLRLRQLYGDAQCLTIGRMTSGGTLVSMTLPLRYAAALAESHGAAREASVTMSP
jgi:two-component system, LytTR family, sensor kinase